MVASAYPATSNKWSSSQSDRETGNSGTPRRARVITTASIAPDQKSPCCDDHPNLILRDAGADHGRGFDELAGHYTGAEERVVRESDDDRVERFRDLYDATYPRIMAYTHRRAPHPQDALDAVSETFMVVWRRLDDMPTDRGTVPWVYGVARRVLANQYRSRDRKAQLEHRLKDHRSSGRGERSFDVVHEALDALRANDREILTLAAWDDLDNAEIAEVLGISSKNVAVRLHRARRHLARELGRLGMHSAASISDHVKSEDGFRTPNGVNGTPPGPGEVETP